MAVVVNEDKPVEYEGETLNIGKEMVENLKEDSSLNFSFTDKEVGLAGAERRKLLYGHYHTGGFFSQCSHPYPGKT